MNDPKKTSPAPTAASASPSPGGEGRGEGQISPDRERTSDLIEAAKIFGVDIGNAGDALQHALERGREGDAKRALARLHERYQAAYTLLQKHIKELPVLN